MQKVKIILHGYLKDLYPEDLVLSGVNVSEIINGMCKLTKAFNPSPGVEPHTIAIVGYNSKESLFEQLHPDVKELHLVPAMCGGKSGGFARIILGAVLIAASFLIPGSATLFGASLSSMVLKFGVSLVLGGLLEMLSPAPKKDVGGLGDKDPEASKYLGATGNTTKIGTRIPLLYGKFLAYGHILSFDVDAVDVVSGEANPAPDSIYEVIGAVT